LEQLLYTQKSVLEMFHAQLGKALKTKSGKDFIFAFENYYAQMSRIPQKTAPFKGYESQIKVLF
jgi:hypothetical protein